MNEINFATRLKEANTIVTNYVTASLLVALVPIPIVDLVGLTGIQLKMLHSLSKLYNIQYSANLGKSLIAALLGGVLPIRTSLAIASSARYIFPGWGTASSIVSILILGGASTYAIGKVFIQHFESGGTFLNFDPEAVREHFIAEFEQGKQVVNGLKSSPTTDNQATISPETIDLTTQTVLTAPVTELHSSPERQANELSTAPVETKPTETIVTESPLPLVESKPNEAATGESSVTVESKSSQPITTEVTAHEPPATTILSANTASKPVEAPTPPAIKEERDSERPNTRHYWFMQ